MPRHLDLILTCTGRTASGFYSRYLSIAGIPCGHEKIFTRYEVALNPPKRTLGRAHVEFHLGRSLSPSVARKSLMMRNLGIRKRFRYLNGV
jgi:hypothetical protein